MKKMLIHFILGVAVITLFLIGIITDTNSIKKEDIEVADLVEDIDSPITGQFKLYDLKAKTETLIKEEPPCYGDIPLDFEFQREIWKWCKEYKVEFFYVIALMESESGFDEDAVSLDGHDYGLMQIRDCNHEWIANEYGLDVLDPHDNVQAAIRMISEMGYGLDAYELTCCYKMGKKKGLERARSGNIYEDALDVVTRCEELVALHQKGDTNGTERTCSILP